MLFALSAFLFIVSLIILAGAFFFEFEEEWIISFVLIFLSSVHMLAFGILGQYIGRIYDETRNRPLYIVKDTINF